jgi:HAE1 family hydrophobic/amphiphilic exporter-1
MKTVESYFADVTLPPGSTLENTENTVKELDSIIESMDISRPG